MCSLVDSPPTIRALAERKQPPPRAPTHDNADVAYDEDLADRIRELIASERGVDEKKMFGGLAFLLGGHMSVTASGQGGLMVRVDPDEVSALIDGTGVEPMVMRGREMLGWLRVDSTAMQSERELRAWVERGVKYARSLPPK